MRDKSKKQNSKKPIPPLETQKRYKSQRKRLPQGNNDTEEDSDSEYERGKPTIISPTVGMRELNVMQEPKERQPSIKRASILSKTEIELLEKARRRRSENIGDYPIYNEKKDSSRKKCPSCCRTFCIWLLTLLKSCGCCVADFFKAIIEYLIVH